MGATLSVILAAAVSFGVSALLLLTDRNKGEGDLAAATANMEAMKGKKSVASGMLGGPSAGASTGPISQIVFACDAGMDSSAMGASMLRRQVHGAGFKDVTVVNRAIPDLTDEWDLMVTHRDLADRAAEKAPSAVKVSVDNFMNAPEYDQIVELVRQRNGGGGESSAAVAPAGSATPAAATASATEGEAPRRGEAEPGLLTDEAIVLNGTDASKDEAITEAGKLLLAQGAVELPYLDSMHEREKSVSTFMGNGLAIPHGTNEAKSQVKRSALAFVRHPGGVGWNGQKAEFVVGIAAVGDDHLALLQQLALVFADQAKVEQLRRATTPEQVREVLDGVSV